MNRLDYICFTNLTGYAQAAKGYIRALHQSGKYDIRLTPLDMSLKRDNEEEFEFFKPLVEKKKDLTRVQIFHCIPEMQRRFSKAMRVVGVGTFETTDPPKAWVVIFNQNDALIVPSFFDEKVFAAAGVKVPIIRIPHCLDMNAFTIDVEPMFSLTDRFVFLFLGAWKKRKGYDTLIEAWKRSFTNRDSVKLLIKTDKAVAAQNYVKQNIKQRHAPVEVDGNRYTESQMPSFVRSACCMVCPSRGEGFGLPALQAMAVGVPVIVTNYSGCQDYANDETAYLLDVEGFVDEKCMDGIPQFTGKRWAYISVEQLSAAMKGVYQHYQLAIDKAKKARTYVASRFGYNSAVEGFDALMDRL